MEGNEGGEHECQVLSLEKEVTLEERNFEDNKIKSNSSKDLTSERVSESKVMDEVVERESDISKKTEISSEEVEDRRIDLSKDEAEKQPVSFEDGNCSDISSSSSEDANSDDSSSSNESVGQPGNGSLVSPACIMYQKDVSTSSVASSSAQRSTSCSLSRENSWVLNHSQMQPKPSGNAQATSYDRYIGDWLRLHPKSRTYSSTTNSSYLARSNAQSMKNYSRAFNTQAFQFAHTNQFHGTTAVRPNIDAAGYTGHVDPREYSMYKPQPLPMQNYSINDPHRDQKNNNSHLNSIEEGSANKPTFSQDNLCKHENKMAGESSTNTPSTNREIKNSDNGRDNGDGNSESGYQDVVPPLTSPPPPVVNVQNYLSNPDTNSPGRNKGTQHPSNLHVSMSINSVNTIETAASTATHPQTISFALPNQANSASTYYLGGHSYMYHDETALQNNVQYMNPSVSTQQPDPVVEHGIKASIRETSAGSGTGTGTHHSNGNGVESSQTDRTVSAQMQQVEDDLHMASSNSKYETYACRIDRDQGDTSVEIPLFSFERPHMRAFHFSWMSFFVGFFAWYAITPLLSEVQDSLDLSKEDIWTSSLCAVAGTVIFRISAGPLCDWIGARWVAGVTLFLTAIPTMATGLVQGAVELCILRLLQGIAGSLFVTGMYWTSSMFTREVAGTANAVVAGWGNLGGGVTQLITGSLLFPLFKWIYGETNLGQSIGIEADPVTKADRAWRTVFIIPALLCFIFSFIVIRFSDDCPKGNYRKLKKLGLKPAVSVKDSFKTGSCDINTWLLFVQYACCFGVELTTANAAPLFFKEEFHQSTESAAAIASIFGWMNLFARGLGGFFGDILNVKLGMRGRLLFQAVVLALQGISIIAFSYINTLSGSIVNMAIFSLFVQASEGSTFGIVPYVNPSVTGSIVGIIGAGGNFGGVLFSLMFRQWDYRHAFNVMGWTCVCSAFLSFFISIKGQSSFFCGTESKKKENQPKHLSDEKEYQGSNTPNINSSAEDRIEQGTIDSVVPK